MVSKKNQKRDTETILQVVIIGALLLFVSFNVGKISMSSSSSMMPLVSASEIIPSGVPEIYGATMSVSYNDVSPSNPRLADATISKLSQYEDMELNAEQLERYTIVAGSISCEYCCGADSIIFANGERACGCAHSYAMRGLAKYLITEHSEISDEEVLSELGKWKVLFFPDIHEQKAAVLEANGIDSTNYINLASNLYRGIEQGQSTGGSMVGGC
jgi:hypothetical protein